MICACGPLIRADVLIPPGYHTVVQITDDEALNWRVSMNNLGQLVFAKCTNPNDWSTSEIFLYDNGKLSQLTNDDVRDDLPDINDAGDIAWSRGIGAGATLEIVLLRDGKLTRVTDDAFEDYSPILTSDGRIVWNKWVGGGCEDSNTVICLYDGASVEAISDGLHSDQYARPNDLGDIVWTRFDFCQHPWMSQILLLSVEGVITLTDTDGEPRAPDINNHRLVAYLGQEAPDWQHHIHLWKDGATTTLTDWGSGPHLNDRGDVLFARWHDDSSTWQVWLYRAGKFYQLTDDPFWNRSGVINQRGDIAWVAGPSFNTDVKLLVRLPLGDLNCDGLVDAFDIDPFVLAFVSPGDYVLMYPDCDRTLADVNMDGNIDAFDIDPFVDLLTP